jgi:hypothetical protein
VLLAVTIHDFLRAAIYAFRMSVGVYKHTNHYTGEHVRPAAALMSTRQCTRTGCSERAKVSLTYDYDQSHAWLDPLLSERDPHAYDMCERHAERLSVPYGWHLEDRRLLQPSVSLVTSHVA